MRKAPEPESSEAPLPPRGPSPAHARPTLNHHPDGSLASSPIPVVGWRSACSSAEYPYSRPRARLGLGRARPYSYSPTSRSKPMTQTAEHTTSLEMTLPSEPAAVPALVVDELRKEFIRKDGRRKGVKRRRRVAALKGVSFTMQRGDTVAILGQNGSGKSTLVRLVSTLLLPDGGSAKVFGNDVVKDQRAVQRLVNRVSVEASFFKKMSSEENLSYAARFYDMPPSETRDKIPELLEHVGFPVGRRHEGMEHLSRGMQQKVALARALLTSPVLLLLDEPTTGLDPRSKLEVQDFIR